MAAAGQLPVVLFTAGGIATPADAAMMMQLGADGVFVGSGIFKSGDPAARAAAIVKATTFHDDPDVIAKVSRGLGEPMVGINLDTLAPEQRYAGAAGDGRGGRHGPRRGPAAGHGRPAVRHPPSGGQRLLAQHPPVGVLVAGRHQLGGEPAGRVRLARRRVELPGPPDRLRQLGRACR